MNDFTVDTIQIGEKITDRIIDSEGTHWYPLRHFLLRILRKSDKVSSFRDSNLIKYMKVFEYTSGKKGATHPIKMWCMNEDGIKYLLRHMRVRNTRSEHLFKARQKGFYEACLYFGVKTPEELEPVFINQTPNLDNYDIWSVLCLSYDNTLTSYQKWRRCLECNYYYPDTERYFGKSTKKCLQCQGRSFKCKNKIAQYIYDHNGLDLLYQIHLGDTEKAFKLLNEFINQGYGDKYEN